MIGLGEIFSFFIVLVRVGIVLAVLPFFGDRTIFSFIKVLLSLSLAVVFYPLLKMQGFIRPDEALVWSGTTWGNIKTVGSEVLCGLAIGFSARIFFDSIQMAGSIIGTFMGFASANMYDPHQEIQVQVIEKFYTTLGMMLFLALNGHHYMLKAIAESYRHIGVGAAQFNGPVSEFLISITAHSLKFGFQMAAPLAVAYFGINIFYGVMAKAMPQFNILVLSFSVSTAVGLIVMFLSLPEFADQSKGVLEEMGAGMNKMIHLLGG